MLGRQGVGSHTHKDTFREHLETFQVGVGTRGGCEALVHTCRQWMTRNKEDKRKILVKVDISNAFNCVDWQCSRRLEEWPLS